MKQKWNGEPAFFFLHSSHVTRFILQDSLPAPPTFIYLIKAPPPPGNANGPSSSLLLHAPPFHPSLTVPPPLLLPPLLLYFYFVSPSFFHPPTCKAERKKVSKCRFPCPQRREEDEKERKGKERTKDCRKLQRKGLLLLPLDRLAKERQKKKLLLLSLYLYNINILQVVSISSPEPTISSPFFTRLCRILLLFSLPPPSKTHS